MATRSFQNPPVFYLRFPACAKLLKALHLGLHIVRFDIKMYAARVLHPLYGDLQSPNTRFQGDIGAGGIVGTTHGQTQGLAPELHSRLHSIVTAIKQNGTESAT